MASTSGFVISCLVLLVLYSTESYSCFDRARRAMLPGACKINLVGIPGENLTKCSTHPLARNEQGNDIYWSITTGLIRTPSTGQWSVYQRVELASSLQPVCLQFAYHRRGGPDAMGCSNCGKGNEAAKDAKSSWFWHTKRLLKPCPWQAYWSWKWKEEAMPRGDSDRGNPKDWN